MVLMTEIQNIESKLQELESEIVKLDVLGKAQELLQEITTVHLTVSYYDGTTLNKYIDDDVQLDYENIITVANSKTLKVRIKIESFRIVLFVDTISTGGVDIGHTVTLKLPYKYKTLIVYHGHGPNLDTNYPFHMAWFRDAPLDDQQIQPAYNIGLGRVEVNTGGGYAMAYTVSGIMPSVTDGVAVRLIGKEIALIEIYPYEKVA